MEIRKEKVILLFKLFGTLFIISIMYALLQVFPNYDGSAYEVGALTGTMFKKGLNVMFTLGIIAFVLANSGKASFFKLFVLSFIMSIVYVLFYMSPAYGSAYEIGVLTGAMFKALGMLLALGLIVFAFTNNEKYLRKN